MKILQNKWFATNTSSNLVLLFSRIQFENFLIIALCILCYWPGIFATEYVFDDREAILSNKIILLAVDRTGNKLNTEHWFLQLWQSDFWGNPIRSSISHKSYRPITTLTFIIEVYLFGFKNIGLQRFNNILLHCYALTLVYQFLDKIFHLFGQKPLCIKKRKCILQFSDSFLATLYFAVHPIHSDAVCSLVGRAELLMTIFALAAILQFLKILLQNSPNFFTFSMLAILSILSKEQGFMIFPICALLCIMFQKQLLCLLLCVEFSILLIIRLFINGFEAPKFSRIDNPITYLSNRHLQVINTVYTWFINLFLLIFPNRLSFDYSEGSIKLLHSIHDERAYFLYSLIFIGIISTIFIWKLCHSRRLVLFLVMLGSISFLPSANIFIVVGFIIAERVLYLPSIAFCAIVIVFTKKFRKKLNSFFQLIYTIVIASMVGKCIHRSYDWNSQLTLYLAGITTLPNNAKIHYNLAKVLADKGDFEGAKRSYISVLQLNANHSHALNNLALIIEREGNLSAAADLLKSAIRVHNSFAIAWMNLGIVQMQLGNYLDAERSLQKSLKLRTNNADCLYNLGNLNAKMNRTKTARQLWWNATTINPHHEAAWINFLISLEANDYNVYNYNKLQKIADRALSTNPTSVNLYTRIGIIFAKFERLTNMSEIYLRRAIQLNPQNPNYWMNLGIYYHQKKQVQKAVNAYRKGLKLNPTNTQIIQNLSKLNL